MARAKIASEAGGAAVRRTMEEGVGADRNTTALAVRYTLQVLAEKVPGATVEVRVPPFGAVQCIEGPGHTRGTPPNVIETDPETWLALATGAIGWSDAVATGKLGASGQRATLEGLLPLRW
jgi:hypothetical protein